MNGRVAQEDSDPKLRDIEGTDAVRRFRDLPPRQPSAVVFDRRRIRLQVQDVGDASAEWMVGHHRILGVAAPPSERAASSACPSGFPSRV